MIAIDVDHWFDLDSADFSDEWLSLRFVPEWFDSQIPNPVVRITITSLLEVEAARQHVSVIQQQGATAIELDDSKLSIWVDHWDVPFDILGSVVWTTEEYEIADYAKALKLSRFANVKEQQALSAAWHKIDSALSFIDRTIDRLEKRKDLIRAKDEEGAKQIQLLKGVRRQLKDD